MMITPSFCRSAHDNSLINKIFLVAKTVRLVMEYTAHVFTSVRLGHRLQNATFEVQERTRDSSTRKFAFG